MNDPLHDRVVKAVGDRYLIEVELGRGAASVVYRATDMALKRRMALKVLPPERAADPAVRERFRREAEIAARLAHPAIVPIHAVDERDGIAFVVMAYVDGQSLEAQLAREPRPPVAQVRRILAEIADALAYAHSRGVVHRDVTPANIMLERESGRPMLTDFGIARATSSDHSRLTAVGMVIGTPAYMAPEQAMGDAEVDGRADVYSLGIIGWQMLAGEPPFAAPTALGLLMKQVAEPLPALIGRRPDAPPDLVAILERALAKAPDGRWSDAGALRDALRSTTLRSAAPSHPATASPSESTPAPARPLAPRPTERPDPRTPVWPPGYVPLVKPRHDQREDAEPVHGRLAARDDHRARIEAEEDYRLWGRTTSLVERARAFRRAFFVTAGISSLVVFSPEIPPLVVLPVYTLISSIGLRRRMRSLRADGLRIGDVLRGHFVGREPAASKVSARANPASPHSGKADRQRAIPAPNGRLRGAPAPPTPPRAESGEITRLAPGDVLDGPYGQAIRDAADDREAVRDAVARLAPEDRALLPDVEPTVTGLVERVASLAVTLHRLDAGLSDGLRQEIAGRLEAVRAEPESAERERRIALLERQDEAVADLTARRRALADRLDSAGMALRTLRLDLVRLRASGVGASIEEVSSATQEARALSRDIAVALEAARELRRI